MNEHFDDAEAQRLLDAINWRSALYAGKVRHVAATQQYAEARSAAIVWADWHDTPLPGATVERLWRHVVDLAATEPVIKLSWLHPAARSTQLIGRENAAAIPSRGAVLCPPVVNTETYGAALHEIGHLRDAHLAGSDTLTREVAAWTWARSHAAIWDRQMERSMVRALRSYIGAASRRDVLSVVAAEHFLSVMATRFKAEVVGQWRAEVR